MQQEEREAALQSVCGSARNFTLVTTDTWTQGFYPQHTSAIINYDLPSTPEGDGARFGRSSGFGCKETVISFMSDAEQPRIQEIEKLYGIQISQIYLAEMVNR